MIISHNRFASSVAVFVLLLALLIKTLFLFHMENMDRHLFIQSMTKMLVDILYKRLMQCVFESDMKG